MKIGIFGAGAIGGYMAVELSRAGCDACVIARGERLRGTLTASRFNDPTRSLYARLRRSGKLARVALIACIRKLLTILNAMIRDNQNWRQTGPGRITT